MNPDIMEQLLRREMDVAITSAFGLSTSQIAPDRPPMTADIVVAQMRQAASIIDRCASHIRIVIDHYALEATAERRFPKSRHRSARIRKKLIKRFGCEFLMRPCMWKVGNVIYAHPAFEARLRASANVSVSAWAVGRAK